MEEIVKDFSGNIIARINHQPNGDKVVRNFYGQNLGKYDAASDVTRDVYGRIIASGDQTGMLIK